MSEDRVTLRFLAAPQDAAAGGRTVAAGSVLEWIDRAGYACAVAWAGAHCVTAYVGNVRFRRPIAPGQIVQASARIIDTGRTSMQVAVVIEAAELETQEYVRAADCLLVFVAVGEDGRSRPVPTWEPRSERDALLQSGAAERLAARRVIRDAMLAQSYTDAGTAPWTTFRFLAQPSVVNYGGNAHGGTVMRWIDEVAFATAASWSSEHAVAVYSGGIHFLRPIHIGDVVQLRARLIHTTEHSMHLAIRVMSAPVAQPGAMALTTTCMSVFVNLGEDGHATAVRQFVPVSEEDRRLDEHACEIIRLRQGIEPLPV